MDTLTILTIICIFVLIGCIIYFILSYHAVIKLLSDIYNSIKNVFTSTHLSVAQTVVSTLPLESKHKLVDGLPDNTIDIVKCRQKEISTIPKPKQIVVNRNQLNNNINYLINPDDTKQNAAQYPGILSVQQVAAYQKTAETPSFQETAPYQESLNITPTQETSNLNPIIQGFEPFGNIGKSAVNLFNQLEETNKQKQRIIQEENTINDASSNTIARPVSLPFDDDTITHCKAKQINANDVPLEQPVQSYDPRIILY
jgi:hypothetical protein